MNAATETASESAIRLTQSAADQVISMQASQPENAGKALRIYVEAGGCSGLQYGMTFDEVREGDRQADFHGVKVLVDPVSAEYLQGTVVDYADEINDGGFKIHNPRARQSCGCGRSFEA